MEEKSKTKKNSDFEEEEKYVIKTILKENGVYVCCKEDIEGLTSRGYGIKNEDLILNKFETLYLLSKNIIEVEDEKTKTNIGFQEFLEKARDQNNDVWIRHLIYRDLRSRGYVVREGFGMGIDFRVYKRGEYGKSTADYLILGIQEGKPARIEDLVRVLTRVQSQKKILILSVINRRGEIVYYSLSKLNFR